MAWLSLILTRFSFSAASLSFTSGVVSSFITVCFITFLQLNFWGIISSYNKFGMNGQFLSTESHSFFCHFQWNTVSFEKDTARAYAGCPEFGSTLTFTHTDFGRFTSYGAIRENTDPELTFTLHLTGDSLTGSFYLTGTDPAHVQCFQSERAE